MFMPCKMLCLSVTFLNIKGDSLETMTPRIIRQRFENNSDIVIIDD